MKIYGIAAGYDGYGSGDIFTAFDFRPATHDEPELAKDIEGTWVEVLALFYIKNGEPEMIDCSMALVISKT